jgi:hypothetical protein
MYYKWLNFKAFFKNKVLEKAEFEYMGKWEFFHNLIMNENHNKVFLDNELLKCLEQ